MQVTTFKHIPHYILSAINDVGVAEYTLEKAYGVIAKAFAAEEISVADGKMCLALCLVHHMPSKYAANFDKATGVKRNTALIKKVGRDWSMRVVGVKADSKEVKAVRVAREAQAAIDALIETYGAKVVREALKRATTK